MSDGTPSFEEQVNTVVSQIQEDGSLPDGVEVDESVMFAAKLSKRHRDTQSAYTKGQQRQKALEAENNKLAASWEADAVSNLSNTEQAELEELKVQDPDAWRTRITELEESKRTQFKEKRQTISQEVTTLTELEQRELELANFNEANPDFALTDDVIQNDIPPRLTNQLKDGSISFVDFLEKAKAFVTTPKKIAETDKPPVVPDFASARGSNTPDENAITEQNKTDYTQEIF